MSDTPSIAATAPPAAPPAAPRAAIARAAQATGVDFGYLLAEAKLESSLDPAARADRSSAAGLFQFTNGTWASALARYGAEHGLGWAQGALSDPARAQAMALRYNPDASAMMAAELARDNGAQLTAALGRQPDGAELYLAHFLGLGGAKRFLGALGSDPETNAAALFPEAAAANPATFYAADGSARSVGQMMALLRSRIAAVSEAGGGEAGDPPMPGAPGAFLPIDPMPTLPGTLASAPRPAAVTAPQAPNIPALSAILDSAFGASDSHAPAAVRTAYAQLRAFGL